MQRSNFASLIALALSAAPQSWAGIRLSSSHAMRDWQPTSHRHRSHGGGHAGQAAKRKARNRKRNKIARASRCANRA